jgi:F-type H+-transporting ATPase subunit delta
VKTRPSKGLESDVDALEAALEESADLRAVIASPIYMREDQGAPSPRWPRRWAFADHGQRAGADGQRRRLFVLPQLVRAAARPIAEEKGEVTAEVATAKPLTKAQADKLAKVLKARIGKTVKLNTAVDESLIGGLVVKVGSKMIDTSIRSRLAALQNAMKEVG